MDKKTAINTLKIEGLELTDEQVDQYLKAVDDHGKVRAGLHPGFNDADFAMGAALILYCADRQDKMPASWLFNPMQGRPIWSKKDEKS